MFDVHIYGTHARDGMIAKLSADLNLSKDNIHYDDRINGGPMLYTAKKAWLADIPEEISHRIVLQDDVEVCRGFQKIAFVISENYPKDIISFFPYNFRESIPDLNRADTPYFIAPTLSCCGVMMPVEYIQPCFQYIDRNFSEDVADDEAIQEWARHAGVRVLTTIPALIQHIGDESIANKGAPIRRTVYYQENPQADWNSKKILHWREFEWFFSNHGKRRRDKGALEVVSTEG